MVFLRYLTCLVAAIAVISYTVHLERNTPVVLKVKNTLGLDTTNLAAVRRGESSLGVLQTALALVGNLDGFPNLGEGLSGSSNAKRMEALPPALSGWMREDRALTTDEVAMFEASFLNNQQDGEGKPAEPVPVAGAFYFRENMRMLITISDPSDLDAATGRMSVIENLVKNEGDVGKSLAWRGQKLAKEHDKKSGFKKVNATGKDGILVQVRGNVTDEIITSYLETIPLFEPEKPKAAEPSGEPAFADFDDEIAGRMGKNTTTDQQP